MGEFKKLIDVCNLFNHGDFGMKEFQDRLGTVCLPDECYHTLNRNINESREQLEEIIYCYGELEKWRAYPIADELIKETLSVISLLSSMGRNC